jgi:hypothetical protein
MVSMFLMPMQLIIRQYKDFYITLGVFIVSIIFMYFFWYRNLPSEEDVKITEDHLERHAANQKNRK